VNAAYIKGCFTVAHPAYNKLIVANNVVLPVVCKSVGKARHFSIKLGWRQSGLSSPHVLHQFDISCLINTNMSTEMRLCLSNDKLFTCNYLVICSSHSSSKKFTDIEQHNCATVFCVKKIGKQQLWKC